MDLDQIQAILPGCCEADALPRSALSADEIGKLECFFQGFQSIIVLAHHVRHSLEWVWYPFDDSPAGVVAPADLHLQRECDRVAAALEAVGQRTFALPYPGRCGIRFKDLAKKTGLGSLGDNYMFLHRKWGPWAHLRVLLTDKEIGHALPPCTDVCLHCGACSAACPSGAIRNDFSGTICDSWQGEQEKKIPNYVFKCEICARICPVGKAPPPVHINCGL